MVDDRAEPPEPFDLPGAIRGLAGQIGSVAEVQRSQGAALQDLRVDFEQFKRQVTGSKPPGPDEPPIASVAMRARAESQTTGLELESLKGQVIGALAAQSKGFEARLNTALESQNAELATIRKETLKQSTALGIGVQGFQWLRTREGKAVASAFAAFLFALAALVGGARSVAAVAAPLPASTVPR